MSQLVRVRCPECEAGLRIPEVDDDTVVTCPRCGAEFTQGASAAAPRGRASQLEDLDEEEGTAGKGSKAKRNGSADSSSNQVLIIASIITVAVLASVAAIVLPLMMKKSDSARPAVSQPVPPPGPAPAVAPAPRPAAPIALVNPKNVPPTASTGAPTTPASAGPAGTTASSQAAGNPAAGNPDAGPGKGPGFRFGRRGDKEDYPKKGLSPMPPAGSPAGSPQSPAGGNPAGPPQSTSPALGLFGGSPDGRPGFFGRRFGEANLQQQGPRGPLDLEQGKIQIIGSWETVVNDPRTKRKTGLIHNFEKDGKYSLDVQTGSKIQPKSAGYWELIVKNDSFQVNIHSAPVKDGKPVGIKTVSTHLLKFEGNDTMVVVLPQNQTQTYSRKKSEE